MDSNRNEGCFLDFAIETSLNLFHPQATDTGTTNNFNWYINPHSPANANIYTLAQFSSWQNKRYSSLFKKLYKKFHSDTIDYMIIPNVGQMITSWYDPTWLDDSSGIKKTDGAMMEDFGDCSDSILYMSLERAVRHITGKGKILIAQSYADSAKRHNTTAMYMLIKNQNSFINFNPDSINWYPDYEVNLGNQSHLPITIDSLRVAGANDSSLFARNYDNGIVLYNTSNTTMNFTVPSGKWLNLSFIGGGVINSDGSIPPYSIHGDTILGNVNIPANSGVILLKYNPSSVNEINNSYLSFYSFISNESLNVSINSIENCEVNISLYNILGEKVYSISNKSLLKGINKFEICNINLLKQGIYIIKIDSDKHSSTNNIYIP